MLLVYVQSIRKVPGMVYTDLTAFRYMNCLTYFGELFLIVFFVIIYKFSERYDILLSIFLKWRQNSWIHTFKYSVVHYSSVDSCKLQPLFKDLKLLSQISLLPVFQLVYTAEMIYSEELVTWTGCSFQQCYDGEPVSIKDWHPTLFQS